MKSYNIQWDIDIEEAIDVLDACILIACRVVHDIQTYGI